jgi:hypothetical protein
MNMSELDDLPEPVRDALILLPCMASSEAEDMAVSAVQAELLRLSSRAKELERENAELYKALHDDSASIVRAGDDERALWKQRWSRAEADLAALKEVIADGAVMPEPFHDGNGNRVMVLNADRVYALLNMKPE